ncbi:unnamed protein product [Nippostrongylus brasiliensis]|uniref:Uncharacterized protein n=1 Tax=Nippostrongylus brasiliensis TaxID=27835 RepID=A0A0N4XST6_NIPBR|nr:unnamed protein product [Nippostrongylus brasiliensis]
MIEIAKFRAPVAVSSRRFHARTGIRLLHKRRADQEVPDTAVNNHKC